MLLSVVLPSPGGPCSSVWSSGSPRYLAASTNTSRFSTTFCCPLKSPKRSGRRAFSNSRSAAETCSCLMSKSASIVCSGLLIGVQTYKYFPRYAPLPASKVSFLHARGPSGRPPPRALRARECTGSFAAGACFFRLVRLPRAAPVSECRLCGGGSQCSEQSRGHGDDHLDDCLPGAVFHV